MFQDIIVDQLRACSSRDRQHLYWCKASHASKILLISMWSNHQEP